MFSVLVRILFLFIYYNSYVFNRFFLLIFYYSIYLRVYFRQNKYLIKFVLNHGVIISLPFLPAQLWPGVIVPVSVSSMRQIDLFENYKYLIGLVSLFNGISTLFRLFNAKAILLEEQQWHYLTHNWEDKGVHTFPKGICPKVNVIARLEYELANYDSAVHRFNHYTTRTPPISIW